MAYRLFDVTGDVSLSGTIRVNVSPRPRGTVPFVGYGTLSGTAVWLREGRGRYAVEDWAAQKELRLVSPGLLWLIR